MPSTRPGARRRLALSRLGTLVAVAIIPIPVHGQEFIPLGWHPGGFPSSIAYDVSPDGSVVVGVANDELTGRAFRWEDGVMTNLGDHDGVSGSVGFGVSGNDVVVGYTPRPQPTPYRWVDGVLGELSMPPHEFAWAHANKVSADGSVIVGYYFNEPIR